MEFGTFQSAQDHLILSQLPLVVGRSIEVTLNIHSVVDNLSLVEIYQPVQREVFQDLHQITPPLRYQTCS